MPRPRHRTGASLTSKIAIVITLPDAAQPGQQAIACLSALAAAPLRQLVDRVHVFVPAGTTPVPDDPMIETIPVRDPGDYIARLNRVVHPLAEAGTPVLFTTPEYEFDGEAVAQLLETLSADPLYGFAVPRTNTGGSAPIPRQSGDEALATREPLAPFLQSLPSRWGGGIVMGAPVLVRGDMLYHFGRLEGKDARLSDALARLFIRANRRGYSAVVCNRALFFAAESAPYPGPAQPPSIERAADYARAISRRAEFPEQRWEALLWQRLKPKAMRTVLFDIRNLAPGYNGTAQHILSLLDPIVRLAESVSVSPRFWVLPEAAQFHGLDRTMPDALIHTMPDDAIFDAAIRLSQPWSFSELRDQARRSTVNLYLIMDAIAWDCHYIRMPHIDGVWRAAASYADGFVFNSGYTRNAFHERFPASRNVPSAISYCSLDPAEYYAPPTADAAPDGEPYVLVVGNQYYHKGLHEAVRVLAAGFPEARIRVLGEVGEQYPNVEQLPSGMLSNEAVDTLFRECACLVFPSFYEGFGLPVLKALSFGKPVIARQSQLIDEIRSRVSPVDGIVPFSRRTELLEAVSEVLERKEHWRNCRTQSQRPAQVFGWEAAAREVLSLVDASLRDADAGRCLQRLEFFYRIDQFDVERAGWANATQNKVIFEVEMEE